MPPTGRPRSRPEAEYIRGPVWVDIPVPVRDGMVVKGYEWKSTDLIVLLNLIPDYSPFIDAEGYYFDVEQLKQFISFVVNECVYPEGINTGDPFVPEQWQWCIYANMFCWKSEKTHFRRYREVFIYVPRKNGKTSAFGMIPTLYEFYCSDEKRAQLFCCAADTEQASVNFRHSVYSIETNTRLLSRLREQKVNRSTRSFEHTDGTTFKVLSSIAETKHGLSPSFVYADEIHAHKDSELIDVMITGMAARPQPLLIYTTTADYDRPSVCNSLYDRAKSIQSGKQTDPTFLPVIYEASIADDYHKEEVWRKANPNYEKSIYAEHFERMIRTAESNPAELNKFLRLHLNVKTKTETTWIPSHIWVKGAPQQSSLLSVKEIKAWLFEHNLWHNIALSSKWGHSSTIDIYIEQYQNYYTWYINKVHDLQNAECYGGYDNSSTKDIAAFTLWFPNEHVLLFWGWCPGESIYTRSVEQNVPYSRWYEAGLINDTPQTNISEVAIGNALIGTSDKVGIASHFKGLMSVSFDRWGSNYIHEVFSTYGISARAYPQSFAGMNQPCRVMETMVSNEDFWHGGHPVLEWMIGNTMVEMNRDEQIRPSRKNSSDKIDGIVSGLMAIGGHLYPEVETIRDIRGLKE